MDMQDAPQRAGVHHVKLPVTDLARSREWITPGWATESRSSSSSRARSWATS
jgi:hypothetical protein